MKIAYIGQKGIPATFGGIEFHVEELARRLHERGHDITVYVRSWYTPKERTEYDGIRLVHTPTVRTKHLDAFVHSFSSSLDALFSDYDIIHYHALGPTFFSWLPKLGRAKIVATLHGLDWQRKKWGRGARSFLKFTERTAIRIPDQTIVVSKSQKSYFESKYGREVRYIPNGVTITVPLPPDLIGKTYGLAGKDYLLFMGRLVPEKRIDWLMKAFLEIDAGSEMSNVKLVIAGGSSGTDAYVSHLRELASGNERIIFTGNVTGREKNELLGNARLFVLPSELEGLPIALLEAMSFGLPCLASDIPPHREVVDDGVNGFLFQWDDHTDFVRKLKELVLSSEGTGSVGGRAREKVRNEFRWDAVVDETEGVYEDVLEA